jgi:hypothetical protein
MKSINTNWTKEDLLIYTLIYCANADYVETHFEIEHIKSKIKESNYDKIKAEFIKDKPNESLVKIKDAFDKHGYTADEKEFFFDDIRDLFVVDGKYSIHEQELFKSINNIIEYRF